MITLRLCPAPIHPHSPHPPMASPSRDIRIRVTEGDLFTHGVDVLALMRPEAARNDEGLVGDLVRRLGTETVGPLPERGAFSFIPTDGAVGARAVLLAGTPPLAFRYDLIRSFARAVLAQVGVQAERARTLALPAHGSGYGLDAQEAFRAEVAGIADALESGDFPARLQSIAIVERDPLRVALFRQVLADMAPEGTVQRDIQAHISGLEAPAAERFLSAGAGSAQRPHVFVAMSFNQTDELYDKGIYAPVSAAGYICERGDRLAYTGDVLTTIKNRIDTAALVIADLTGANANVYLEVGYAWGRRKPTVLVVQAKKQLKFNVRAQKFLRYRTFADLAQTLERELVALALARKRGAEVVVAQ